MRRFPAGRSTIIRAWSLRLLLVLALVINLCVGGPRMTPALLPQAKADGVQPVSGAFNLGSNLSGSIDARTGQFSASVPLVSVPSVGDSGIDLTLSWVQARAGAGQDRMGWGLGWSLGMSYVDPSGPNGVTVYTAAGGSYSVASDGTTTFPSGLQDYVLDDISFAQVTDDEQLPARPPAVPDPVTYEFTLTYDDGRIDYFDPNGNLVARVDRFGNRIDLQYQSTGLNQWQPTAIIDAYGLTTTFSYVQNDQNSTVTVSSPKRSDGRTETSVITLGAGPNNDTTVDSITDPVGRTTSFQSQLVGNNNDQEFLDQITTQGGAQSQVTYAENDYTDANNDTIALLYASSLAVTGPDGPLNATRYFNIDPTPNPDQHNYAGNNGNNYLNPTQDLLFGSGDTTYTYTTEIYTESTATFSTYDSAHRLVGRTVTANDANDNSVVVQQQNMFYPPLVAIDQGVAPPPNYTNPTSTSITSYSRSGPNGPTGPADTTGPGRTVTTKTAFDSHGRIQSATDETGAVTTITYDDSHGYGMPISTTTTDPAGQVLRTVSTTLTADHKSIQSTTQADLNASGKVSARSVVSYTYDGAGRPTSQTTTWAGAAPPGNGGGPASTTTHYDNTFDLNARTRTIAVTSGFGTNDATTTKTVVDLVSGQAVKSIDGAGLVTQRSYDEVNRILEVTPPTGLATTTSYTNADPDNNVAAGKTVTEADGHVTVTAYDATNRVATVTDNVRNGVFVANANRPISTMSYSADGTTVSSTDRAGRTSTTVVDPVGRVVSQTKPSGLTTTTSYDDVDNTTTDRTYGVGDTAPSEITGKAYDAGNRVTSSRTTYPVSSRTYLVDPAQLTSYDGLGRVTSSTADDLTAVPDFAGPGGVPITTTIGPAKTARAPGTPVVATDQTQLNTDITKRTLSYVGTGQQASPGPSQTTDALGNVRTETDGLGRTTTLGYDGDGRPTTQTAPDGTTSVQNFDPATGQLMSLVSTSPQGAKVTTSYTYVPAGKLGAGLVSTATNESGTITYGYDADRNQTSVAYPDGSQVRYDYNDDGTLHTMTDITGAVTTYAYNPDATMKSATQVRGTTTLASVGYLYDDLRRIHTVTRGNGLVTTNTYTPNNLLGTQTTLDGKGNQVEAHSYSYDNHHNLRQRIDSTAQPSTCVLICGSGASTYGTYTTTYKYDAYDRLIGSAVYSGPSATGTPRTQQAYVLDVSGNIQTSTQTTSIPAGTRPTTTTQTRVNTYDAAAQLTTRTVGSTVTQQSHNLQGQVLTSLTGSTTTYRPDGLPATVAANGATTTFSYWADGTRRRAVSTGGGAGTTTIDYHYGADGALVNDTTTQTGGTNAGSASASYLMTGGREARTLLPGTTGAGKSAGRTTALAAPVTTGAGVGYILRDRHNSVTALVDSSGAVTNTYAYDNWGAPALLDGRSGQLKGATTGTLPGTTNPLQFGGAAAKAMYTDSGLGTMMLPSRFYDPSQARFTSPDVVDAHNLYLGFDGNPIMNLDPTGQDSVTDTVLDVLYVAIFVISAILTYGAATAAFAAVSAAAEITAAVVVPAVAESVALAANAVGAVTSGIRFADDMEPAGKKFLTADQRSDLSNIATVAGSVAGVAGGVAGLAHGAEAAATDVAATAAGPDVPTVAETDAGYEADDESELIRADAKPANVARSVDSPPPGSPKLDGTSGLDEPTSSLLTSDTPDLPKSLPSTTESEPPTATNANLANKTSIIGGAATIGGEIADKISGGDRLLPKAQPPVKQEIHTDYARRNALRQARRLNLAGSPQQQIEFGAGRRDAVINN